MPKHWHDTHTINKMENISEQAFQRSIVADKKPYFMRYIYPALKREYNEYITNTNKNALREFQLTVDEMKSIPTEELTDRQKEFLKYYNYRMPVGTSDCVMNKICRRFEEEFDGYIGKWNTNHTFDHSILQSGRAYNRSLFYTVKNLCNDYANRLKAYSAFASFERVDKYDKVSDLQMIDDDFRAECEKHCPDGSMLCDVVLDVCYSKSSTRRFAWGICGDEIINNLLEKNNYMISFPVKSDDGEFEYSGERFTIETKKLEAVANGSIEGE